MYVARSIGRQVNFLKYYGVSVDTAHKVVFESMSEISLYGEPYATVEWDEYDTPLFTFEDGREISKEDIDWAVERDYESLYFIIPQQAERWLRCIDDMKGAFKIVGCRGDLPEQLKSLALGNLRGLIEIESESSKGFGKMKTMNGEQMVYEWTFVLGPQARGYLKWRSAKKQQERFGSED